jgi:hypothetical protein
MLVDHLIHFVSMVFLASGGATYKTWSLYMSTNIDVRICICVYGSYNNSIAKCAQEWRVFTTIDTKWVLISIVEGY